ncbi:AMP-dependent synthetase and ligase domain protein [Mycobacterium xenopi 4042]|uniref:AMP-dependent synthetase and ligase domain protein n=1 Tax=Mycobacterium xenopi 4042 TaxID=1299334 RepID=X8AHW3_MYCXE|nr:AMP-dependent synthetase and ligase domain protein [Mycobacterium xenopi 4042]
MGEVADLALAASRGCGTSACGRYDGRLAAALACFRGAADAVTGRAPVTQAPIIHIYRRREVAAAVDGCGADVLIVDGSTATTPLRAPASLSCRPFRRRITGVGPRPASELVAQTAPPIPLDLLHIWATGRPKAVRHSDATLLTAAAAIPHTSGWGLNATNWERSPFRSRTSAALSTWQRAARRLSRTDDAQIRA